MAQWNLSRTVPVLVTACTAVVISAGAEQQSLASRTIQSASDLSTTVWFPTTPGDGVPGIIFESYVLRAASGARVAVGFERIDKPRRPPDRSHLPTPPKQINLAGRSLAQALDLLTRATPSLLAAPAAESRFTWREDDGVISVTPVRGQPSLLDTMIPALDLKDTTLPAAATAIHRVFDAQYPDQSRAADELPPVFLGSETELREKRAIFKRTFSVSLTSVTVRQALNAIVKAHGETSWIVVYPNTTLEYPYSVLAFQAFNGAWIGFSPRTGHSALGTEY